MAVTVVVLCDLLDFVGVCENSCSLACDTLNVSVLQKSTHFYARLTYALAKVGTTLSVIVRLFSSHY